METSNFGLYGCPRVSIEAKFDARSNGGLRYIPSAVGWPQFTKNVVFDEFFTKIRWIFALLSTFFAFFPTTVHQSEYTNQTSMKFLIF